MAVHSYGTGGNAASGMLLVNPDWVVQENAGALHRICKRESGSFPQDMNIELGVLHKNRRK
jgi:hypothetical protein